MLNHIMFLDRWRNVLDDASKLEQPGEDCNGCWRKLNEAVDRATRSIARYYRHRAKSEWKNEDGSFEGPVADFSNSIFRRLLLPSTSIECDSCWLILKRRKLHTENSNQTKDFQSFGQLVKKTMLNNGWL